MNTGRTFYVVDCSYYFRASYFALPPIFTPTGILVNAVYGFLATLLKLIKNRRPTALVVADDAPGRYFRHKLLPGYKSGKKPVPEECNQQMPILRQALDAMAISYVSCQGFEADDIIATLSVEARLNGFNTFICSRDKDLQQLLADDAVIYDISSEKETTCAILKEKLDILPSQIPDLLALVGDKVDSIPGVPSVGLKTAVKLLNLYDTLEKVVLHAEELSGKIGTTVEEHREQAFLAKKLATLRTDVPIKVSFNTFTFQVPNKDAAALIFRELGFEVLLKRFEDIYL